MITKITPVHVTVNVNKSVAIALARAEMEGVYSMNGATAILERLEKDGINEENLAEYFIQCANLQAAFCQDKRNEGNTSVLRTYGFRFSTVRTLYLPVLAATILSQMGDCNIGPYDVRVCAAADAKVDAKFVAKMSAALDKNRHFILAERDQIGVANRDISPDMMSSIVVTITEDDHALETGTMVGTRPDRRAMFMSAMMGLVLVNQANNILYPFQDYFNYADPGDVVSVTHPSGTKPKGGLKANNKGDKPEDPVT